MESYQLEVLSNCYVQLGKMNTNILLNTQDNSLLYHIKPQHKGLYAIFTTSKHNSDVQFAFNGLTLLDLESIISRLTFGL